MRLAVAGALEPPKRLEGLRPYEPGVGIGEARRLSGSERIARPGCDENFDALAALRRTR